MHTSTFHVSGCIPFADIPKAKGEREDIRTWVQGEVCDPLGAVAVTSFSAFAPPLALSKEGRVDPSSASLTPQGVATPPASSSLCPALQCSFALVQYGDVIQTEFDLRYSQDVRASLSKVQNITQVKNVTKTASAMQHVL